MEHFKHSNALKAARTDSARIDQLMAVAAKPEEPAQPERPTEVRSPYYVLARQPQRSEHS